MDWIGQPKAYGLLSFDKVITFQYFFITSKRIKLWEERVV